MSSWAPDASVKQIQLAIARGDYEQAEAMILDTELGPEILASLQADIERVRS